VYCRGVTVFDPNDRVKINLKDGRWAPMGELGERDRELPTLGRES